MGQQFAQLLGKYIFKGMEEYIGKVFPVVRIQDDGRYTLQLEDYYRLSFPLSDIKLFEAVEEPAPKLEWKVGTKVLVKKSSINRPHFNSRVGYVGTIEVVDRDSDRFKVKFPEASFEPDEGESNYSSWWWESELELVPDDFEGGKKPSSIRLNGKCYIAGDGKHLTKDISKATLTKEYHKYLSDKLASNLGDFYDEYRQGLSD